MVSLLYLLFRRVLAVGALRFRSNEFKELEIVVLRHELAVLRRQAGRPQLEEADRVFLAAASRLLSKASRPSFFVRPDTLLGWHRRLVRRRWTYAGRPPGRPCVPDDLRELVLPWLVRIRAGAISGSSASLRVWVSVYQRRPLRRSFGRPGFLQRPSARS